MQKTRAELERLLIASGAKIRKDQETGCLDAPAVDNFIARWYDLVEHYESNDDRDIGVEVVRDYWYWLDRFVEIVRKSGPCAEDVDEALADLEGAMLKIVAIVEKRTYPFGR